MKTHSYAPFGTWVKGMMRTSLITLEVFQSIPGHNRPRTGSGTAKFIKWSANKHLQPVWSIVYVTDLTLSILIAS